MAPERIAAATGVLLAYALLSGMVAWKARRAARSRASDTRAGTGHDPVLVVHASQTGTAQELARATAEVMRRAGHAASVHSLGDVALGQLQAHRRALFVLSTCGEGDAPDEALPFMRRALALQPGASLEGLQVGILALGDRRYARFCGFARRVETWLQAHGARAMFEPVEVDALAPDDLARWQQALHRHTGQAGPSDWLDTETSPRWRLVSRKVLNAGSVGAAVLQLELEPEGDAPTPSWEAGDLARLVVPGADGRPRDYSIASMPGEGPVRLLVRRVWRDDGTPGVASGWLADAPLGSALRLQRVAHPTFRIGENARRPLILIGNGTGIAGLRSHLAARSRLPGARHWLLFGERQRAHDFHFGIDIEAWRASGLLERVDLAFSRDGEPRAYVQDRLRAASPALRAWVADGAAIYVCGSRLGMAQGVDEVLFETLGEALMTELSDTGRYRRDVY